MIVLADRKKWTDQRLEYSAFDYPVRKFWECFVNQRGQIGRAFVMDLFAKLLSDLFTYLAKIYWIIIMQNSSYISLAATQQIWRPDLQFQWISPFSFHSTQNPKIRIQTQNSKYSILIIQKRGIWDSPWNCCWKFLHSTISRRHGAHQWKASCCLHCCQ